MDPKNLVLRRASQWVGWIFVKKWGIPLNPGPRDPGFTAPPITKVALALRAPAIPNTNKKHPPPGPGRPIKQPLPSPRARPLGDLTAGRVLFDWFREVRLFGVREDRTQVQRSFRAQDTPTTTQTLKPIENPTKSVGKQRKPSQTTETQGSWADLGKSCHKGATVQGEPQNPGRKGHAVNGSTDNLSLGLLHNLATVIGCPYTGP